MVDLIKHIKWSVLLETARHQFVDFEFGDKPIFSFSLGYYGKNLFTSKYPYVDRKQIHQGKLHLERYFYKPTQKKNVQRLIKLEQKAIRCKIGSKKWVEYTRKIGRLYGYSNEKIKAFIKKMLGKKN